MIPSMSGSSSASGTATGGDAGGIGDKSTSTGGGGQGLFNNTGIQFGNKGIDSKWMIGGAVALGGLFLYLTMKK